MSSVHFPANFQRSIGLALYFSISHQIMSSVRAGVSSKQQWPCQTLAPVVACAPANCCLVWVILPHRSQFRLTGSGAWIGWHGLSQSGSPGISNQKLVPTEQGPARPGRWSSYFPSHEDPAAIWPGSARPIRQKAGRHQDRQGHWGCRRCLRQCSPSAQA